MGSVPFYFRVVDTRCLKFLKVDLYNVYIYLNTFYNSIEGFLRYGLTFFLLLYSLFSGIYTILPQNRFSYVFCSLSLSSVKTTLSKVVKPICISHQRRLIKCTMTYFDYFRLFSPKNYVVRKGQVIIYYLTPSSVYKNRSHRLHL